MRLNIHSQIKTLLGKLGSSEKARVLSRYFKTGKGEYGEGDRFHGVSVPDQRKIAKQFHAAADEQTIQALLDSTWHEERLTGLLILNLKFRQDRKNGAEKKWVDLYLSNTTRINNWDLVDSTAPVIVGEWLLDKERSLLESLARSPLLWENRIAMVSTLRFIREQEIDDCLRLAAFFLSHPHDLMHKATGWMLREAWKKAPEQVETFLRRHHEQMPRTMLRYAIEKMQEKDRKAYLMGGKRRKMSPSK